MTSEHVGCSSGPDRSHHSIGYDIRSPDLALEVWKIVDVT